MHQLLASGLGPASLGAGPLSVSPNHYCHKRRNKSEPISDECLLQFSLDPGGGVTEGQMDRAADGQLGLGPGRGHLELGGQSQGRLGGAAPGSQVRPADDDDDGRRGAVQDQVEEEMEGGDHWRPRQEDQRPDGRQGGQEEGQAGGHSLLHSGHRDGHDCGVPSCWLPSGVSLVLSHSEHHAHDAKVQ